MDNEQQTPTWTRSELREFDRITAALSEPGFDNISRPLARVELRAFVDKHGAIKCDAMYAHLMARDRKRRTA